MGGGQSVERQRLSEIFGYLNYEQALAIKNHARYYELTDIEILKILDGAEEYFDKKMPTELYVNNMRSKKIKEVRSDHNLQISGRGARNLTIDLKDEKLQIYNKKINFDITVDLPISNFEKFFHYYNAFYYSDNNSIIILFLYRNFVKVIIIKNLGGFEEIPEYKIERFDLTDNIFSIKPNEPIIYIATFDKNLYKIDMEKSLENFEALFTNIAILKEYGDDVIYKDNLKVRFNFEERELNIH